MQEVREAQVLERIAAALEKLVAVQEKSRDTVEIPQAIDTIRGKLDKLQRDVTKFCDREKFTELFSDPALAEKIINSSWFPICEAASRLNILEESSFTGDTLVYVDELKKTMARVWTDLDRGCLALMTASDQAFVAKALNAVCDLRSQAYQLVNLLNLKPYAPSPAVNVPEHTPEQEKTLSGIELEVKLWAIYGGIAVAKHGCSFTRMLSEEQKLNHSKKNNECVVGALKWLARAEEMVRVPDEALVDQIHGGKENIYQVMAALSIMQTYVKKAESELEKIRPGDYTDKVSTEILRLEHISKLIDELTEYLKNRVMPLRSEGPAYQEKLPTLTAKNVVDGMCAVCTLLYNASTLLGNLGNAYGSPKKKIDAQLDDLFQAAYWTAFLPVGSTTAGISKLQSDIELTLKKLKSLWLEVGSLKTDYPEINEDNADFMIYTLALEIITQTKDFLIGIVNAPKEGLTITEKLSYED